MLLNPISLELENTTATSFCVEDVQTIKFCKRENRHNSFFITIGPNFIMANGSMLKMPIVFDVGAQYGMSFLAGDVEDGWFLSKVSKQSFQTIFDEDSFYNDFFKMLAEAILDFTDTAPEDSFTELHEFVTCIQQHLEEGSLSKEVVELFNKRLKGLKVESSFIKLFQELADEVSSYLPTDHEAVINAILFGYGEIYDMTELHFRKPAPELLESLGIINEIAKQYVAATPSEQADKPNQVPNFT